MRIRGRHCPLDIQRFGAERLKSKLVSVRSNYTLLGTQPAPSKYRDEIAHPPGRKH